MLLILIKIIRKLFDLFAHIIGPESSFIIAKDHQLTYSKIRICQANLDSDYVLIYYHGGGWIMGSVTAYEPICQYLANNAKITVISVEYRLAPEHKFPSSLNDAKEAFIWVQKNYPNKKIIIAGDSAGGNLTLQITAEFAKEIIAQMLIYPVVDTTSFYHYDRSKILFKIFNFLFKFYLNNYLADIEKRNDHILSPLYYDNVDILPPTLVISAGTDILAKQNFAYVAKLIDCNVPVTHYHYPDMLHGFLQFAGINNSAEKALKQIIKYILACKK